MTITDTTPGATPPGRAAQRIPRSVLFGNPDRINARLSPDGTLLAYAAPHEQVMNVWIEPVDGSAAARPVTADRGRGITEVTLCAGGRLVYRQDSDGDEGWRLYVLDLTDPDVADRDAADRDAADQEGAGLAGGAARLVTPEHGVQARVLSYHPWHPDRMLVALNADDPRLHDVYELDLTTGDLAKIASNPGHDGQPPFAHWLADADLHVRVGVVTTPDGGIVIHVRDTVDGPYRPLLTVPADDFDPRTDITFTRDGTALIMKTSLGAPAMRLVRIDVASGHLTTIASDPDNDLADVWLDATTLEPIVAVYQPDRARYDVLDPAYTTHVDHLTALDDGDVTVVNTARDGRLTLAATTAPDAPTRYYLYDHDTRQSRYLFNHHAALARHRLAAMEPFCFTARDGLKLHGYLTQPATRPGDAPGAPDASDAPGGPGGPGGPPPAVVLVHGGPWARDTWRYHPEAQWLADRGYAVIQVNFRGSTGYGKAHLNAGNRQWGRAMQHDLLDAIDHLARDGVIDPDRVGICGGSYGGYAALCGATLNQDVFACAVSLCGPTDLHTLLTAPAPYVQTWVPVWHARVGHPEHDADRLREVSPLTHAAAIRTPLLIAQGATDPRVPPHHAEALVAALNRSGVPTRYLLFTDEGHGLTRPANRETFYAEVEAFLATHLGGTCEPTTQAGTRPNQQPA